MPPQLVCVGKILTAHGVRGAVKLRSYTEDPLSLIKYSPLYSVDGATRYTLRLESVHEDVLIVKIEGVKDRNDAELLRHLELYADKALFGELAEEEFFCADLVGMAVRQENGDAFGTVAGVHDFGGGTLLELTLANGSDEFFSFTRKIFPIINVKDKVMIICPPEVDFVRPEEAKEE